MDTNPEGEVTEGQIQDRLEAALTRSSKEPEQPPQEEETVEDEPTPDTEEATAEADSDAAPAEPDDNEEVEWDGEVYAMPKKIKEALLRQQDYTKKTQEVAEQRKAVEERAEMLSQQEQLMAVALPKVVELKTIDDRLNQFKQLDWSALVESDPVQATKLNIAYQQLQQQRQEVMAEVGQMQNQHRELTEKQRQQTLKAGMEQVKKAIPNFNAELARSIAETTKGYGFSQKEIDQLADPRFVLALHDAHQWRKLQASKSTVTKKVADVKPVKTTARTSTSTQATSKVQEARQNLAKRGGTADAEAFFERLLTSRKRA